MQNQYLLIVLLLSAVSVRAFSRNWKILIFFNNYNYLHVYIPYNDMQNQHLFIVLLISAVSVNV